MQLSTIWKNRAIKPYASNLSASTIQHHQIASCHLTAIPGRQSNVPRQLLRKTLKIPRSPNNLPLHNKALRNRKELINSRRYTTIDRVIAINRRRRNVTSAD